MNYAETLNYLYTTLPMFSHMGSAAFKKDLTNTIALCKYLGNPHSQFKTVHVGGTNGKGSVSHMLASVLQTGGYKTGLYTSPHLYDFRERIRVNGIMADEAFVVDFVERIQPVIDKVQPSFFEITVAMAFDYFAKQKVDIAIIEVGLGGRLDSTNIIIPELSVITNIGWDHMNMLGNTLAEIAFEKAGIIKENIPVVIGERKKETQEVFQSISSNKRAPLFFAGDRFAVEEYRLSSEAITISVRDHNNGRTTAYKIDLPGIYQTKNLLTVLQAMEVLKDWKIDRQQIQTALKTVKRLTGLYGRWEVIHKGPDVVLEVAHNKDGLQQMLDHLGQLHFNKLHIIIGMVKDKDVNAVLAMLPTDAAYYFTRASIPRALDTLQLQTMASSFSLKGAVYQDVNAAIHEALTRAAENDLIIVCGSIFLIAEVNKSLVGKFS